MSSDCVVSNFLLSYLNFCDFFVQVLVPLLTNEKNHDQWPKVVSEDVRRHVHNLKSNVYVVSGQAKGKTLLPLPVGTDKVEVMEEDEK
jgi:dynein heavy chain